jgi:hypothetical protein
VPLSPKTFTQAAKIAEQIELLETKLSVLLQGAKPIVQKQRLSPEAISSLLRKQKQVLGIHLYKMLGVQSLGDGLFQAK